MKGRATAKAKARPSHTCTCAWAPASLGYLALACLLLGCLVWLVSVLARRAGFHSLGGACASLWFMRKHQRLCDLGRCAHLHVVDSTAAMKQVPPKQKPQLVAHPNMVVPLQVGKRDGIYWVNLHLSKDQTVRAAFDTGSSHLVVGTEACVRKNKGCDGALGRYLPTHRVLSKNVTLHFGSQSVVTDIVLDSLRVRGMGIDTKLCKQLLNGHPEKAREDKGDAAAVAETPTHIYAAKAMRGDTNANVFGMAPLRKRDKGGMIQTMWPRGAWTFGVLLGAKGGLWVLGPPPVECTGIASRMRYVPNTRPRHLQRASSTQFYMTPLHDVLLGTSLRAMKSAFRKPHRGMWLMTDTGSTDSYPSMQLSQALTTSKFANGEHVLALVLQGGVTLVLEPKVYAEGRGRAGSSLDLHTGFMDEVLGVQGLLLGNVASRGLFMQMSAKRLGFAST